MIFPVGTQAPSPAASRKSASKNTLSYMSKKTGSCAVARPHDTDEIEPGYLFAQKARGTGYATEITDAATAYGFKKLGFREIIAITDAENAASQKVLEKIGFRRRGIEIVEGEESLVFIKKKSDE